MTKDPTDNAAQEAVEGGSPLRPLEEAANTLIEGIKRAHTAWVERGRPSLGAPFHPQQSDSHYDRGGYCDNPSRGF